MSSTQTTGTRKFLSATLSDAEDLFVEMIRQIQEEREEDSDFFNSEVGDTGIGFSLLASSEAVTANITGEKAVQDDNGLGEEERKRLSRRGWTLPEEEGGDEMAVGRSWKGVTSRADRRHIAAEMLSVATEIYGLSEDLEIRFYRRP